MVAASFCVDPNHPPSASFLKKLKDSKKLSEIQRSKIFEEIIALSQADTPSIYFGIGVVDSQYIDTHNIRQATKEA